ncbi:MAG: class I SAM-dependent methyltransferase, partial [Acidobacteria bacterium]|nr:class I SAM-dependent methyltransferase [Acidobacteriota bacterium]
FDVTAMAEDRGIPGALVECGVAEGGTSAMLALANRCLGNTSRAKWLFDSYEGLPEPTQEDYEGGTTGDFIRPLPKGACLGTVEQVEELMFETLCFSQSDTFLIKGWFQDSVPKHRARIGDIAVLRLDGDWYESTKIPLENLYDFVSPGGFVIIDDYGTCFGSRKAVDEFRRERRLESPLNSDGRGGVWFEKPRDDTD